MTLIFLAVLWISYFFIHSFLISHKILNFFELRIGRYFKYYRLAYNFVSIIFLMPVVYYTWQVKQQSFFVWTNAFLPIKYLLVLLGIMLLYLGARKYSMKHFLGIVQLKNSVRYGLLNNTGKLDKSGILGIIRHPFYAAVFPLIWSRNMDFSVLVTNIIFTVYVLVGTRLEERKLIKEYGVDYLDYKKEVSMYFPYKWIKRKLKDLWH